VFAYVKVLINPKNHFSDPKPAIVALKRLTGSLLTV
jgi:hypothetical protein